MTDHRQPHPTAPQHRALQEAQENIDALQHVIESHVEGLAATDRDGLISGLFYVSDLIEAVLVNDDAMAEEIMHGFAELGGEPWPTLAWVLGVLEGTYGSGREDTNKTRENLALAIGRIRDTLRANGN